MVSLLRRPSAHLLRQADPRFLRAMCHAVIRWDGWQHTDRELLRIHGDRDWMIRCPADGQRVAGAGHLAVLTHPDECMHLVRQHWFGETRWN